MPLRQSSKQAALNRASRALPGAERREAQSLPAEEFAAELGSEPRPPGGGRPAGHARRG